MDAMEPATRFSDLEREEMTAVRPSRWVVIALVAAALLLLTLAAVSSERSSAPPHGDGGISQSAATKAVTRPLLSRSARHERLLLY
jgi:hypothetical protein